MDISTADPSGEGLAPLAAVTRTVSCAEAWEAGVRVALNHAIRNPDGITLRLEHLDERPWVNPYSGQPRERDGQ